MKTALVEVASMPLTSNFYSSCLFPELNYNKNSKGTSLFGLEHPFDSDRFV